jgi:hypothetical protein
MPKMGCIDLMHYYLLGLFFFLDLLMMNAFVPACLRLNRFQLELHQQLLLYIAFVVIAFSTIIAVVKFKAIIEVGMRVPDSGRFFSLNLILSYRQQNFNWGLVSSSLLCLIIVALSSRRCHLYYFDFCFLQPNFKQLFLNFASFVVRQVLIDFK